MSTNWHYAKNGEKHGPITAAQLKELAKTGRLASDDLVWREDMKEWRKASSVKGLFPSNQQPSSVSSPPQSVAAARQEELRFWERPAVIALAFLLFWPAGAYLLWKKFHTSSTKSISKFPSVPRSWVFAGAGIGAILLVGAIVLTITQTSAARKEIAEATTLWEQGRQDEAVAVYQSVINKRGPFIPDDQESLVYGRVIDFLSQHNGHQEARLILEKLNRLSPTATPFVESEPGRQLISDIRREQAAERQQRDAEGHKNEPEIVKESDHPNDDTTYQLLAITVVGTLQQMGYPDTDAVAFNRMMRLAAKELGAENVPDMKKWLMVEATESEKWNFEGKPMQTVHYGYSVKITFMYVATKGGMNFAHADIAGKQYGPLVLQ